MVYKKLWPYIYNMLNEGRSLNRISRQLSLNKSTVYYHYRKIFGKKTKDVNIAYVSDNKIGEFVGAFAGDGCYFKGKNYHYTITCDTPRPKGCRSEAAGHPLGMTRGFFQVLEKSR